MRLILIPVLVIFNFHIVFSQEYKKIEDKEVVELLDLIFQYSQTKNIEGFKEIISKEFYCIICDVEVNYDNPYIYSKEDFIIKYLNEVLDLDLFTRAFNTREISIEDTSQDIYNRAELIIHFTIYETNELTQGHEGGSLGIYLKKEDGKLKFSGLETIP